MGPERFSSTPQSGDLEGLSKVERVDSESVNELMEEGNAFEAGIVSGLENSRERYCREFAPVRCPKTTCLAEIWTKSKS